MMAREFGGCQLYIPQYVTADHRLVRLLGQRRAHKICDALGHGKVVIPLGPNANPALKRREIAALLKQGLSHNRIAAATNCHIRTVERIAAAITRCDERQGTLL